MAPLSSMFTVALTESQSLPEKAGNVPLTCGFRGLAPRGGGSPAAESCERPPCFPRTLHHLFNHRPCKSASRYSRVVCWLVLTVRPAYSTVLLRAVASSLRETVPAFQVRFVPIATARQNAPLCCSGVRKATRISQAISRVLPCAPRNFTPRKIWYRCPRRYQYHFAHSISGRRTATGVTKTIHTAASIRCRQLAVLATSRVSRACTSA